MPTSARLVSQALDDVDAARLALDRALHVPWVSDAADHYREVLGAALHRVRGTRVAVVSAHHAAVGLEAAKACTADAGRSW